MKKILIFMLVLSMLLGVVACTGTPIDPIETEPISEETSESGTEAGTVGETEELTTATSTETTAQEATSATTEAPTTESAEAPTTESTEAPATESTEAPTTESTEAPATESTEAPTTESTEAPTTESTEAPATESTEAPATDTTEGSTTETTEAPEEDILASVGTHDRFDLDTYMRPLWSGNVVHNETVMFIEGETSAPLLYSADKILSVRSYDLSIEYVEGVDYKLEDGQIVLLPGTRIPVCPEYLYYPESGHTQLYTVVDGVVTLTMYGEGTTLTRWQIAVTYKHSDEWEGIDVKSYDERYANLIDKLEKGEDVTIFFYGDSITAAATASNFSAPYTPQWTALFCQYIAKQYGYTVKYVDTANDAALKMQDGSHRYPEGGKPREDTVYGTRGTITHVNTAIGGWVAEQGIQFFDKHVKDYVLGTTETDPESGEVTREIPAYGCDLFVLAFGMNHPNTDPDDLCERLEIIADKVVEIAPDTSMLLVSTMEPNPEAVSKDGGWTANGNQYLFEEPMIELAEKINGEGTVCALAPMNSVSVYINTQKRFRDSSGNNVNHPNDFMVRAYAHTLFQTVFGYENYTTEKPVLGTTPVVDANYAGTIDTATIGNVRLEATADGYFVYRIAGFAKEYVNVNASGAIEYSADASTVWTYDAAADVLTASNVALKLTAPEICDHGIIIDGDNHVRVGCARCGVVAVTEAHTYKVRTVLNADGSMTYGYSCSVCGKHDESVPARTLSADVAYMVHLPDNKQFYRPQSDPEGRYVYPAATIKDGQIYVSYEFPDDNVLYIAQSHLTYDGANNEPGARLGKYLAIKYRTRALAVTTGTNIQLRVSIDDQSDGWKTLPGSLTNGEWVVTVVDISGFAGYNADKVAAGVMQTIQVDALHDINLDVEYIISFNDIATLQAMLAEGDTYINRGNDLADAGAEINKDGSCKSCKITANTEKVEGGTKYTYVCAVCGNPAGAPDRIVPNAVTLLADVSTAGANRIFTNVGQATVQSLAENNEVFVRATNTGAATACDAINWLNVDGDYLVVKYRTRGEGTVYLQLAHGGSTGGTFCNIVFPESAEWNTFVVDISNYTTPEETFLARLYIENKTIEIAYLAITDSLEGLVETDTYNLYTAKNKSEPKASVLNADGSCIGHVGGTATCGAKAVCTNCGQEYGEFSDDDHALKVTTDTETVPGSTVYTYTCEHCSTKLADPRTIPNTVTKLVDVSTAGEGVVFTGLGGATVEKVVENNEAFLRVTGASTACNAIGWEVQDAGVKYLVFKYRTNGTGDTYLQLGYAGSMGNSFANIMFPDSADWATVVVDLTEYPHQEKTFCARLYTYATETLDIAYMALSTADSVIALVETDTYMFFKASAKSQPKYSTYNLDGSCTGHVGGTATCGSKAVCTNCGQEYGELSGDAHQLKVTADTETTPGSTVYTYTCEHCSTKLAEPRTYPDSVVFADISNCVDTENMLWSTTYNMTLAPTVEDGEVFVRATPSNASANCDAIARKELDKISRYVVVKYRANANGEIYIMLKANSETSVYVYVPVTTEWQTVVLDLSRFDGAVGNAGTLLVRPGTGVGATIDIAYVAVTDDITATSGLIETNKYLFCDKNATAAKDAVELNLEGSCSVHSNLTNDGSNWICGICKQAVAPVRTYDSNVTYYADAAHGHDGFSVKAEGNEAYASSMGTSPATSIPWTLMTNVQYVVAKYRISAHDNANYFQVAWWTTAAENINVCMPDEVADGEWVTVVIDISNMPTYSTTEQQEFIARFYLDTASTLDVAFVALTSDYSTLVEGVDTYYTVTPTEIGDYVAAVASAD